MGGHGDFSAARDMVHPAKAYYPGKSGCRDFLFRLIGRRRRRAEHLHMLAHSLLQKFGVIS